MEWPRSQRRGREPDALHRSAVKLQSAMLITVTRLLPRRLSSRQGEQSPVLRLISVFSEWTETLLPKGISCNSTSSRCRSETQPGPKSVHKPAGHFAETPSNTASDNRVPKPLRSPGGCTSTCQVTSLTLKSLKTSPYLENLGISRIDARWQALIRPERSPFLGHLLLAADADFCGSLNTSRSSNFLLIFFYHPPPHLWSYVRGKALPGNFLQRTSRGNRSSIRRTRHLSFPWRQADALKVPGSGPLHFHSRATLVRCFCGKLPAQGLIN